MANLHNLHNRTRAQLEALHEATEDPRQLERIERFIRCTCGRCGKPGADEVTDRYGIYFGTLCEECEKASGIRGWEFDETYAGERLEEEDY